MSDFARLWFHNLVFFLTFPHYYISGHALHHFTALGKWEEAKKSKRDPSLYENIHDMDDYESDDGNFDFCIGKWLQLLHNFSFFLIDLIHLYPEFFISIRQCVRMEAI